MIERAAHIVSVSGGKDSTATYCKALERGRPFRAVAADTGNEHPATYEALTNLSRVTGGPEVEMVKADFSENIRKKALFIEANWSRDLQAGRPGAWEFRPNATARAMHKANRVDPSKPRPVIPEPPALPQDIFLGRTRSVPCDAGEWVWRQGYPPLTEEEAEEVVSVALTWMQPTGNPFLDLCIWKGRFPSRKAQFCTEELKVIPIEEQIKRPILATGQHIVSWQGTRRAESDARKHLQRFQENHQHDDLPGRLITYRPLVEIQTVEEVFAIAERHGLKRNPLYDFGLSRVGCFPCINCQKNELALVDRVFPEQIERLEEWERHVSRCAKRGMSTFFNIVNDPVMQEEWSLSEKMGHRLIVTHETHGVRQMIKWAKTDRGGRQYPMFPEANLVCNAWGACE